jgi:hypothetical protein
MKAHRKLSGYYTKLDESPYYIWASRKWKLFLLLHYMLNMFSSVLDPRILYQGGDDQSLKSHLELAKERLKVRYREQYMPTTPTSTAPQPSATQQSSHSPQKVNFTARYKQRSRMDIDELEEFWKLLPEDFEKCNPIQWWAGQKAQFPGASQLAQDVFSIPGEFSVVFTGSVSC